ncbi:MAG: hypothetical protein FWG34_09580 [Oscillospiraceae bacterium]|nr:hypothetical protein [Oscillospiraceae bacterium]
MKSIKTIAFLLIICLFFAACSSNGNNPDENKNENIQSSVEQPESAIEIERPEIPEGTNYGGYEFRVLVPDVDFNDVMKEIYVEEEIGDVMNDAVYKRNRLIENMLDIKIKPVIGPSGHWLVDLPVYARNIIQAGDDAFDAADGVYQPPLAFAGLLENLYGVPNMNLSKTWWDQRMIEDLSYKKSKMYFIIGDIGYYGMSGVFCLIFNKQIFADNGLEYPYEKVRQGKWTFDEYEKLVRSAARDLNGDGKMDEYDQWGCVENSGGVLRTLFGCNENMLSNNAEGIPSLNSVSERHIQVVTAVSALMSDKNYVLLAENIKSSDPYGQIETARGEGRIMTFNTTVAGISALRGYEFDFGVLPYPKFDENQKEYRNLATSYSSGANAYSIPITNSDLGRTGMILEAMSGYSTDIIIPALIDVALKSKYTRDEESAEMIEIILKTKLFDLAVEYGWGRITWEKLYWDIYSELTLKGADTFSSSIEKHMAATEKDMEKFINTFDGLN